MTPLPAAADARKGASNRGRKGALGNTAVKKSDNIEK